MSWMGWEELLDDFVSLLSFLSGMKIVAIVTTKNMA